VWIEIFLFDKDPRELVGWAPYPARVRAEAGSLGYETGVFLLTEAVPDGCLRQDENKFSNLSPSVPLSLSGEGDLEREANTE
jgi:hypothetical protein